jgi:hypothetical protein
MERQDLTERQILLKESEALMHKQITDIQLEIQGVRYRVQEEIRIWLEESIAEDPKRLKVYRLHARNSGRDLAHNLKEWLRRAMEEIRAEREERDRAIKDFCHNE